MGNLRMFNAGLRAVLGSRHFERARVRLPRVYGIQADISSAELSARAVKLDPFPRGRHSLEWHVAVFSALRTSRAQATMRGGTLSPELGWLSRVLRLLPPRLSDCAPGPWRRRPIYSSRLRSAVPGLCSARCISRTMSLLKSIIVGCDVRLFSNYDQHKCVCAIPTMRAPWSLLTRTLTVHTDAVRAWHVESSGPTCQG